jgi:tetratricopeptide (TPR) repeat protein/DNA-binding XRE family transcriptional regulator
MAAKRSGLVQRRKVVGLSQEALASTLCVERSTVVRWERGETEPQPWLRPRLAGALQVSLDELNELLARPRQAQARDGVVIWPGDRAAPVPWVAAHPAREAPAVCQLPPSVADFTGRDPQITQLTAMLAGRDGKRVGVPIAVIAGLPGAGKTALALEVAHRVRDVFPDGQLWVPLDGAFERARDPGEVLGELIRALSVPGSAVPASLSERASLYRSLLAGRRVLVLADDAASAAQVRPLLPGTGQSAVLITSRSDLAGPPGSRLIQLDPLTPAESVQLLARIIGPARVAAEPEAAAALAEASGQLPLAVRITGARLAARGSWPLSSLARKISRARRRLDELENGDMSVRASLTQAYQALDDADQRAFRRLALLDSAELTDWQVAALLGAQDAAGVVSRLADSSLLTATGIDAADQPRYRPHDLVREYAAERLADEPSEEEEAAALDRVTDGWLQLAARADAGLPGEPYFPPPGPASPIAIIAESLATKIAADPVAWFSAERLGLLAVIERCCTTGRYRAAARLASLLASFWHLQGRSDDSERTWRMVTGAAERDGDPAAAARARLRLAVAMCDQGRHAEASPIVDQCVAAFGELGDRRALAAATYWHAACEFNQGAYPDAGRSGQAALRLATEIGDRQAEALALRMLALAIMYTDPADRDEAVTSAERALALARELGEPALELEILHTAAHVCNLAGLHDAALRHCEVGTPLARRLGLQVNVAGLSGIRGDSHHSLGRYREAVEAFRSALPVFRDHFLHRHHALCLLKLGYAYQALGDREAAARHLQESVEIFDRLRLDHYTTRAREALRSVRPSQLTT